MAFCKEADGLLTPTGGPFFRGTTWNASYFIVGLCSGRNSADLMNVLWGMSKEQAQIYRQRAAECEALARHYEAMPLAKYFRELAEQWRQLADQTEGSSSRFKTVFGVFRR